MKRQVFKVRIILMVLLVTIVISSFPVYAAEDKPSSETLISQMNDFLTKIREDGSYDDMENYWLWNYDITDKDIDYSDLTGTNGHIVFGTTTQEPFSYVNNGNRVGFTIDIVYRFCKEYGYTVEFADFSSSSGLITAIQTGNVDFGGGNTCITEERKKLIDYSDPFFENQAVIVANKADSGRFNTEEDLNGATIATVTGCSYPDRMRSVAPDVNVAEYNSVADCCAALDNGLVDGVIYDEAVVAMAMDNYKNQEIAMNFLESDYFGYLFKKSDDSEAVTFTDKLRNSLYRNFVQGKRYLLIISGTATTLLISVISIILGTILGFVIYLITKPGNIIINSLNWFINGLPTVVFLMILYYVVFGKMGMSGTLVSVIAFTLVFASAVLGLLRTSVGAIDKGQFEVSYALGFKKNQAFFQMILPQALQIAWSGYKGAIISQIKATAIVGYIAVADITKTGDMIRSSTFEAFFPLIVVAIIYFIMAWVLTQIVNIISKLIDPSPKKSAKYLKGVKLDD